MELGRRRRHGTAGSGRRREDGVGKDIGVVEEVRVNRTMTETGVDKDAQAAMEVEVGGAMAEVRIYENKGTMAHKEDA